MGNLGEKNRVDANAALIFMISSKSVVVHDHEFKIIVKNAFLSFLVRYLGQVIVME